MTYALIQANQVDNIIAADASFAAFIAPRYQYVVQIDAISPRPDMGWSYDGESFSPPEEE